jgi:hypothetical protein
MWVIKKQFLPMDKKIQNVILISEGSFLKKLFFAGPRAGIFLPEKPQSPTFIAELKNKMMVLIQSLLKQ